MCASRAKVISGVLEKFKMDPDRLTASIPIKIELSDSFKIVRTFSVVNVTII